MLIFIKKGASMIKIRKPTDIFQIDGQIKNGTFHGRWHFSFDRYYDPNYERFGTLRVFNDDTLSPGAIWPLHPHRENEVVTYCVSGEFLHEDEHGKGGLLKKGWVQHTTIGTGMFHSEINNRPDQPMRFVQMWFYPEKKDLKPSVEQRPVEIDDRTNRLLMLASNQDHGSLPLRSDAAVFSSFLEPDKGVNYELKEGRGIYLAVLEGGPVLVNGKHIAHLGAAEIYDESLVKIRAENNAELLVVDVKL